LQQYEKIVAFQLIDIDRISIRHPSESRMDSLIQRINQATIHHEYGLAVASSVGGITY